MPDDDGGTPELEPAAKGVDEAPAASTEELPDAPVPDVPVPDAPAVVDRLAGVEAALTALAHRREDEAERAAARERVIERQHADIERMRTDERFGLLQPVLVDLCGLRNDLLRQAATLPTDLSVRRMADLLESFAASVEDALLRCGVEAQSREVGGPFVPRGQRVARVVEVDDPARDGTVAEVLQDGYVEIDSGRVVVPTRVAVHRAVAAAPSGPPQETNPTKEHVDV